MIDKDLNDLFLDLFRFCEKVNPKESLEKDIKCEIEQNGLDNLAQRVKQTLNPYTSEVNKSVIDRIYSNFEVVFYKLDNLINLIEGMEKRLLLFPIRGEIQDVLKALSTFFYKEFFFDEGDPIRNWRVAFQKSSLFIRLHIENTFRLKHNHGITGKIDKWIVLGYSNDVSISSFFNRGEIELQKLRSNEISYYNNIVGKQLVYLSCMGYLIQYTTDKDFKNLKNTVSNVLVSIRNFGEKYFLEINPIKKTEDFKNLIIKKLKGSLDNFEFCLNTINEYYADYEIELKVVKSNLEKYCVKNNKDEFNRVREIVQRKYTNNRINPTEALTILFALINGKVINNSILFDKDSEKARMIFDFVFDELDTAKIETLRRGISNKNNLCIAFHDEDFQSIPFYSKVIDLLDELSSVSDLE